MADLPPALAALIADPYAALSVRPFINGAGPRTIHGGSLMPLPVRAAMDRAAGRFVDVDELMAAISRRIAALTGAEAGIVTCGASAALMLAAAAGIAGNDPVRMLTLPRPTGPRARALVPVGQRISYDHALRAAGAEIVEVADLEALAVALAEPAGLVAFFAAGETRGPIRLEDAVRLARPTGTLVLVDAAAQPLVTPEPYLARGADLVAYSGGKHLRGPQASGFLLGRRAWVEAAWRHASPHHGVGRSLKVGKEEAIGALAALELWTAGDTAATARRWRSDLEVIAAAMRAIGVAAEHRQGPAAAPPRLRLSWDIDERGLDGPQLWRRLLDGEPRIVLRELGARDNGVDIDPSCLEPGEADVVAKALSALLGGASAAPPAGKTRGSAPDLTGDWTIDLEFVHGARRLEISLRQDGPEIAGRHVSEGFGGPVRGRWRNGQVSLVLSGVVEGACVTYRLAGAPSADGIAGEAQLGLSNPADDGPDRSADQFGVAAFVGRRRGKAL